MARIFISVFFTLLGSVAAYGLYGEAVKAVDFNSAFPYWLGCSLSILIIMSILLVYDWMLSIIVIAIGVWGIGAGVAGFFNEPLIPFLIGVFLLIIPLFLSHKLYGRERPPELIDSLLAVPVAIGVYVFIYDSDAGSKLIGGLVAFFLGAASIKYLLMKKIRTNEFNNEKNGT